MRYKRLELVSQAEGHGFESRLPLGDVVQGLIALRYFFCGENP